LTVATVTRHDDDAQLGRYGYRQQFVRSLRNFESFAVAFSFISITTGIFTTFAFVLATGGPRGIWTWPIVIVGQTLVALVYGALAARVPLSGYSYQWASRLADRALGARGGRVPVLCDRRGGGQLRPGRGAFPAADRRDLHAGQRGPGDARGARAA